MSLSDPLTFSVDRLSLTSPRLLPRGTMLKAGTAVAWEHSSDNVKITLTPREDRVTIEIVKGIDPDPIMVRELPILVKVPTFAPMPNMTYDGTKMMLRYGWPQPFREGSQHMIRLFERESILTIAQLLRPFFKSSPTGTAAPSRQSVSATQQRPRHTIGEQSLESAVKRQRILVSPEPIRANASNIRTRPLSRSNSPAYPSHTSHHKNDEDDDSTRTIRLNQETPYMATRAPWESDRVPSQSHRPAKPASPSLTTAVRDMQFETLHPTLAPILPKEVLTPLIDLQGESQEVLVPGITAPSWPNAATLNRCPSQTPSENDSNGGHVNFPPIPATSWSSVTNHNGTTEERAQSSRSLDAAASHFNASHHAVLGSSETKTLSPSAFAPNILPTVNAAYDWSDEQLEIQIDSILGERGFTHLAERVAQILASRPSYQHLGLQHHRSHPLHGNTSTSSGIYERPDVTQTDRKVDLAQSHQFSDSQASHGYFPVATSDHISEEAIYSEGEYGEGVIYENDDGDFDNHMNSA